MERTTHSSPILAALAGVALFVTIAPRAVQAKCVQDSECKGTRICEDGKCTTPPEMTPPPKAAGLPSAPATVDPTSPGSKPPAPDAQAQPEGKRSQPCECAGTPHRAGGARPDDAQLVALRAAGANLDANDMAMVEALAERGFSGDELVTAYRDLALLRRVFPELARYGNASVETIAVSKRLDLDSDDGPDFVWYRHSRNRTLTEAYNEKVIGGPALLRAGAVTTGVGVGLILVGLELRNIASDHPTYYVSEGNKPDHRLDYPGIAAEVVGGAATIAGIAFVMTGLYRWSTWLPPRTLESTPASGLQSLHASAPKPETATTPWVVLPSLTPQQVSLRLSAAF